MNNSIRVHPLAPVVAVDIDGTLANYYDHFHWFAELYLQKPLSEDWSETSEFSEALGLDKEIYRDIKLAYRQGGMKRSIPPIDQGVADLIKSIRSNDIQVWICTTRPWLRLDNIDPDTRFWLEHNVGRVDGLIYGEDKYLDLIDIVGKDRILGLVDDLPENIIRGHELGLKTMIRTGRHNANFRRNPRFRDLSTTIANHSIDISIQILDWSNEHGH